MAFLTTSAISDLNRIANFLAHSQIDSLQSCPPVDVLVLCVSAIIPVAEQVFSAIESHPRLTKTLVLCGGIGHSTSFLYEAVRKGKYSRASTKIDGLPEARVLERIIKDYFPRLAEMIESKTIKLVVEDTSTNCGANAIQTRRLLESGGLSSHSFIIVQDPTMSLRTLASFRHTYADTIPPPDFWGCPTFIPAVYLEPSGTTEGKEVATIKGGGIHPSDMWEVSRFFDLLMGEIPRLRDDENGYGPQGKNFISHVEIPLEVEEAWARLSEMLDFKR